MRRWASLLVGILVLMIDGYDLQSVGFVAPEIAKSWGVMLASFGPVFAAGLAGTIPGALLAGSVAGRLGNRAALTVALITFGAGSLASGAAHSLTQLIALRFLLGLGLGASVPLVMTLVDIASPSRARATVLTLTLCGQPLGAMLGAALCSRLIPIWGWPSAFVAGGILPALLLPAISVFPRRGSDGRGVNLLAGTAHIAELFVPGRRRVTVFLCASTFLAAFLVYVMFNWLPGVVRAAGYSRDVSLLAIGLFNFGGIIGAVLLGAVSDRWAILRVVVPAFLAAGIAIAILEIGRSVLVLFLSATLVGGIAGYGGTVLLGPLAVILYPPALRTAAAGWALGLGRVGGVVSPLVVGALLATGADPGALFYLAALAAVLAAFALKALRDAREQQPEVMGPLIECTHE